MAKKSSKTEKSSSPFDDRPAHPDDAFEQIVPDEVPDIDKIRQSLFRDIRTGEIVDAEFAGQNPGRVFKE